MTSRAVNLAPQEIDEDLEIVAADLAVAPYGIEQPISGNDSSRGLRQALQNRELGSGEPQLTAGTRHGSCGEIDCQVREAEIPGPAGIGRPCPCSHAGEEHRQRERLGHVVVSARIEPAHDVFGRVAAGEEQDGSLNALQPGASGQLKPVECRKHHVEDEKVERRRLDRLQARRSVEAHRHAIVLFLECTAHIVGQLTIIFNEEHTHLRNLT